MRKIQQLDMFFLLPRRVSKVVRFVVGGHGASRCFLFDVVVRRDWDWALWGCYTKHKTKQKGNPRIS